MIIAQLTLRERPLGSTGHVNCRARNSRIRSNNASCGLADGINRQGIRHVAIKAGLIADPVHEGPAIGELPDLNATGRFGCDDKAVPMHLGGSIAIHAYAEQFGAIDLKSFSGKAG